MVPRSSFLVLTIYFKQQGFNCALNVEALHNPMLGCSCGVGYFLIFITCKTLHPFLLYLWLVGEGCLLVLFLNMETQHFLNKFANPSPISTLFVVGW
jgi:hypothetical protein